MIIDDDDYGAITGSAIIKDDPEAAEQYGIKRRSGRYPYGSGKDDAQKYPWESGDTPVERANAFQQALKELRSRGISDTNIAAGFGMTTPQLRDTVTIAKEEVKRDQIIRAQRLKDHGLSNVAIGKKLGIGESSVRNLLRPGEIEKASILAVTTDMLRAQVEKKKYVDVGKGVELHMGVSHEKLKSAYKVLEAEGYKLYYVPVRQLGTGKQTTIKVLTAPGTQYSEVYKNRDLIQPAALRSTDGGLHYDKIQPPLSVSSKRVKVRYAEEGGADADGVIYVRPGVPSVGLGKSHYAQVRVAVDDSHYLKGMAMYGDPKIFPPGVDLVFNTNKSNTGNPLDAMKPMKKDPGTGLIDPEDPFGSSIRDQVYKKNPDGTDVRDKNGNKVVESAMNIVNEEGKWDQWSKSLSSQMLSKQKTALAKQQLDIARSAKEREFHEIMSNTNDTVKKHLLEKFADSVDSAAVHLKAAHLPRQATKVILPINSLKEGEIYAPTFRDGERVVLIRFPHGGKFEIPELTVNNRHQKAKDLLGNAPDAVGIHSKVAERLSGADFDGDTVLVIPNNHKQIQTEPALKGLEGFDPKKYKLPEDSPIKRMDARTKGIQMGLVSNLITDMTIKGAPNDELARAVRHSMVVIDAEKHGLDWVQSAKDNSISQLMSKYQRGPQGGADTLISLSGSEKRILDRKPRPRSEGGPIDRATGKRVFVETGVEYSPGNPKMQKVKKLELTDNAHTLVSSSKTPIEHVYAEHSNALKNLANQARLELLRTKDIEYSPSAAKVYSEQVKMLEAKLHLAMKNAPLERQALAIANTRVRMKKDANPEMDKAELKKLESKELQDARNRVGAKKEFVDIDPKEWEAIQAGAVSKTMLKNILDNADIEKIKELSTPREKPTMSSGDVARAKAMLSSKKYSLADIADQLGVSVSTLRSVVVVGESS